MTQSSFLQLPRELRDEIYRYLVPAELEVRPIQIEEIPRSFSAVRSRARTRYSYHLTADNSPDLATIKAMNNINEQIRAEWRSWLEQSDVALRVDKRDECLITDDNGEFLPEYRPVHPLRDITDILEAFRSVSQLQIQALYWIYSRRNPRLRYLLQAQTTFQTRGGQRSIHVQPNVIADTDIDSDWLRRSEAENDVVERILSDAETLIWHRETLSNPMIILRLCDHFLTIKLRGDRKGTSLFRYYLPECAEEMRTYVEHHGLFKDTDQSNLSTANSFELIL